MPEIQMFASMMLEGSKTTWGVFFVTLIFSLPLCPIIAMMRLSKNPIISNLTSLYIYLMRGTPLMLQLMFIFFGLPLVPYVGVSIERYTAIYVAFVLNYAAYFAEIFRSGIISVPVGQYEASNVLGFTKFHTFMRIILPQVIKNTMPSFSNEIITLVKDTSLVYVLGVTDILKVARSVSNTYSTFTPYVMVGGIYLIFIAVLTRILSYIEKKVSYF